MFQTAKVILSDVTLFSKTCDDFVGGFWGEKIVKSKQNLKNIAYLEPCQTSNMKRFVKIVNGFMQLIIFTKHPP